MPRTGKTALAHSSCYSVFQSRIMIHGTAVLTSTEHDYVVFPSRPQKSATVLSGCRKVAHASATYCRRKSAVDSPL